MPTQQISGTIYQMYDASGNNRRFPVTVVDGVLGLASYLQEQFSSLANLYMGINDVTLSGTVLTVKGVPVNLATVTDLSNYYTKTEADGRFLGITANAASATKLQTARTIWGQSFDGTANVTGALSGVTNINSIINIDSGYVGIGKTPSVALDVNGQISGTQLISTVTSSAPLVVSSSALVSNLNADKLDNYHLADILASDITGNAKTATNPKSELKTDQEFVFRKTNVEWDAKSGVIKKIKGETLVANQLVEDVNVTAEVYGITRTKVSNICLHYQGTSTESTNYTATGYFPVIAGHKYYYAAKGIPATCGINYNINIGKDAIIVTADSTGTQGFGIYIPSGVSIDADVYVQAVDLTLRYGSEIDGMTDEQIIAKYESEYPNPLPYTPGTLISNDAEAVETTGVNQWDGVTEPGYWEVGTGLPKNEGNWFRTKNPIPCFPNTDYYLRAGFGFAYLLYYDANMNYITSSYDLAGQGTNQVNTTPSNCHFIHFYGNGATDLSQICINIANPEINGQYFPYWKRTLQLGLTTRKDTDGNVPFPNGLQSCPVAQDEATKEGGTIRVGTRAYQAGDESDANVITDGTNTNYALATPVPFTWAEPLPSVYPCDQYGTERIISPESTTPSAPFCADIQYGAKSDDVANDLIGTRDAVQPLLDALQYDGQNHAWHLKGNLYADGFITAYGINGGARTAVIAPYVIESSNYSTSKIWVGLNVMNEAIAKYKQGYLIQAKESGTNIIYSVTSIDESGSSPILYCNGGSVTVEQEA